MKHKNPTSKEYTKSIKYNVEIACGHESLIDIYEESNENLMNDAWRNLHNRNIHGFKKVSTKITQNMDEITYHLNQAKKHQKLIPTSISKRALLKKIQVAFKAAAKKILLDPSHERWTRRISKMFAQINDTFDQNDETITFYFTPQCERYLKLVTLGPPPINMKTYKPNTHAKSLERSAKKCFAEAGESIDTSLIVILTNDCADHLRVGQYLQNNEIKKAYNYADLLDTGSRESINTRAYHYMVKQA